MHDEFILNQLGKLARAYPTTAHGVQQNINEEFGYERDASLMGWTDAMFNSAYFQFAGIADAGEAL